MFDKLKSVEKRYNDLNKFLSDPKIISHQSEFQKYAREQSELGPIVLRFQEWQKISRQLVEAKEIIDQSGLKVHSVIMLDEAAQKVKEVVS